MPKPIKIKEWKFRRLVADVQTCQRCRNLCQRTKVLSDKNGSTQSSVIFIAEAPGKDGADRTGIPLYGDATGRLFGKLLDSVGWTRESVFSTNAVLCNPRGTNGRNRSPFEKEIRNCSSYLKRTIEVIDPKVVVVLGVKALIAASFISRHSLVLAESVGKPVNWYNRLLLPLYHPSPRVFRFRSPSEQRKDFQQLARLVSSTQISKE